MSLRVGIDEVGRGCLCGDVVAAAVAIPDRLHLEGALSALRDSKKLTPKARQRFDAIIRGTCVVAIGRASPTEIDATDILRATMLAMQRAAHAISNRLEGVALHFHVDGNRLPEGLGHHADAIVGGDALIPEISAASIVAKVLRDREMTDLDGLHPGYGWARNAGYPTAEHYAALERLGPTRHHRMSFKGVAA